MREIKQLEEGLSVHPDGAIFVRQVCVYVSCLLACLLALHECSMNPMYFVRMRTTWIWCECSSRVPWTLLIAGAALFSTSITQPTTLSIRPLLP